jgi:Sec-independent protein translocase protein TatA
MSLSRSQNDAENERRWKEELAEADLRDELAGLREVISRIATWTRVFGAELVPPAADTYGEGMRDAKARVARMLEAIPSRSQGRSDDGQETKTVSTEKDRINESVPNTGGTFTGQAPEAAALAKVGPVRIGDCGDDPMAHSSAARAAGGSAPGASGGLIAPHPGQDGSQFVCRVTSEGLVDVEHLAHGIGLTEYQARKVAGALDTAMLLGRQRHAAAQATEYGSEAGQETKR